MPDPISVVSLAPGAGTGVFTRALLDRGVKEADLTIVEHGSDSAQLLRKGVFIAPVGDAVVLQKTFAALTVDAQTVDQQLQLLRFVLGTQRWNKMRTP